MWDWTFSVPLGATIVGTVGVGVVDAGVCEDAGSESKKHRLSVQHSMLHRTNGDRWLPSGKY